MNNTETTTTPPSNIRSLVRCPQAPNFTWDLNDTKLPSIVISVTLIASFAIIFLNGLVVLAFQQKREMKKASTILLSSMAISDLLVGAISMPLNIAANILIIHQIFYSGFCILRLATEFSIFTFIWSSLYHLTFIASERYVAIRKSIHYKVIVTRGLMKTLAVMGWLLASITSSPPLVLLVAGVDHKIKEIWHIGESVLGISCLTAIGYFYIMVNLGVRKRKITEISQVTALVKAKQEIKVAKTTGLITAALLLSFVPVIVIYVFIHVFPVLRTSEAFLLAEILVQLNSLANPLIYFYRDRRFRKAALELLRLRKPGAIQPAVGAARFITRKDQLGSLEAVQERQHAKEQILFKRAASCDLAFDSYFFNEGCHERFLSFKRSLSVPNLHTNKSEFFDGQQRSQASSIVITTTVIHRKSDLRHHHSTLELPENSFKLQDASHLHVQKILRSKSTSAN